jgi:hypothetical protein
MGFVRPKQHALVNIFSKAQNTVGTEMLAKISILLRFKTVLGLIERKTPNGLPSFGVSGESTWINGPPAKETPGNGFGFTLQPKKSNQNRNPHLLFTPDFLAGRARGNEPPAFIHRADGLALTLLRMLRSMYYMSPPTHKEQIPLATAETRKKRPLAKLDFDRTLSVHGKSRIVTMSVHIAHEHPGPQRKQSIGHYLVTRVTTLKPTYATTLNPFKVLRLLNCEQWLYFLVCCI